MADPTCTAGTIGCWVVSQSDIITNLAKSLAPVETFLVGLAYLIGLAFAFKAIYSLKVYGEARTMMSNNASLKEPVTLLIVSAILLYFPTSLGVILQSSFGESSILQYAPVNSKNETLNVLFGNGSVIGQPLTLLIKILGLGAFIRGWVLIARSASQGQPAGGTGKGFIHVFGGVMAMNVVATLQIINNTLYGA